MICEFNHPSSDHWHWQSLSHCIVSSVCITHDNGMMLNRCEVIRLEWLIIKLSIYMNEYGLKARMAFGWKYNTEKTDAKGLIASSAAAVAAGDGGKKIRRNMFKWDVDVNKMNHHPRNNIDSNGSEIIWFLRNVEKSTMTLSRWPRRFFWRRI